jgi:NADH-quinone oxidoreductase subunit G
MAAVATTETVTILINDIPVEVPKGELIVESVKRIGLEIPIFCYHPRMKPVGMCRMCLVEVGFSQADGSVRKMPKPQAACTLPAQENMVVYTDSEMVHRDRKGVLEFLLINHPLDCPICDRGGECPLQNNTLFYGPSTSRYIEIKRHLPKAFPLSRYVTLDLERCIQCGRCVRFTEEISGDSQLAFRFRGASMQPSTFELTNFESKFSGNVIEICPVGALTSSQYRFRARPWDLETRGAICTLCSNGCNIWFDYRVGKMVRVNGRTNEAVNEEWTCDRGKFGHDFYNAENRLTSPFRRQGDKLAACSWAEAYADVLGALQNSGRNTAALAGSQVSNEGLFMLRKLLKDAVGTPHLDHRWEPWLPKHGELESHVGGKVVQSTIAELEHERGLLVFGCSLADELPIIFLRVRKAWFKHGARVIVASDQPTDVDAFAEHVLRYKPGTGASLAEALAKGSGFEEAAQTTGIAAETIRAAHESLRANAATVVTSHGLFTEQDAVASLQHLGALAKSTGGRFNCFARGGNDQGALELGLVPAQDGKSTFEILKACASGEIKTLWLCGVDPFEHAPRQMVEEALENVEFLIVQGIAETEAMAFASVVLPMTAPAEEEGSYTNAERRVQVMNQVIGPKGDARPAWKVCGEILLRIKPDKPLFNSEEVRRLIAEEVPAFANAGAVQPNTPGTLLS